jgi:hypothetical protein
VKVDDLVPPSVPDEYEEGPMVVGDSVADERRDSRVELLPHGGEVKEAKKRAKGWGGGSEKEEEDRE